ncbi:hypothetical protein Tco_1354859 [Tanacetum coccineum]
MLSDILAKTCCHVNSLHIDTRSAYACNDAMNVSCNSRLYASYDVNDLFVFDDVSIRNSQVSKIPFRKKPRDSLNVHSKNNLNNSLPRTLFRWFPKMQPLAEPHKAYWALKHANFDLKTAGDHRKLQLNELNELRDQAYENSLIYKERTKKLHDSKIKNRIFNVGDRVLLFNSRLKIFSRKLKTRWSGPFTITKVFPYGTIELSQPDGPNFKVNGHRVKHYFGGDLPPKVV